VRLQYTLMLRSAGAVSKHAPPKFQNCKAVSYVDTGIGVMIAHIQSRYTSLSNGPIICRMLVDRLVSERNF
jgi:hypothetical protein